ncbi:MAG: hypothetical protein PHS92_00230 [Candidatus Gracilibacteria bacterium]|nr:hypothetical protein [Candidatus Gracilibacteria bacterium]
MVNNSNNAQNQQREDNNQTSPQDKEKKIEKAIKKYSDGRLNSSKGIDFYNSASANLDGFFNDGLKNDFKKFIEENDEFKSIKLEDISEKKDSFTKHILSFGVAYESKRTAIREVIKREYGELNIDGNNALNYKISGLSLSGLDDVLENGEKRDSFIQGTLKDKAPKKKEFLNFLDNLNINPSSITKEQTKAIISIRNGNLINDEQLKDVLDLFKNNPEAQKNIIKAFLPSVSIKKLIDMDILTEEKANSYIKELINNNDNLKKLKPHFESNHGYLNDDIYEKVIIPTYLFPDDVVKKILGEQGVPLLVKEYNSLVDENNRNGSFSHLFELDENGNVTPDFIKKVSSDSSLRDKIKGIDKLKEGVILKTRKKTEKDDSGNQGEDVGYFRIDKLDIGTVLETKLLQVTNLTGPNGIKRNPGEPENLRYNTFLEFLKSIDGGEFIDNDVFEAEKKDGKIKESIEVGEINSISDLNKKLDEEADSKGSIYKVEDGMSFETFKDDKSKYGVFSISINKAKNEITVTNGNAEFGPLSYKKFYEDFLHNQSSRISNLRTPEAMLSTIKINGDSKVADGFKEIVFEDGKFMPQDRKADKNFEGIRYFTGKDGAAIRIDEIKNGKVKLSEGKYKENIKAGESDEFKGSRSSWYGIEIMYYMLQKNGLTPKIPKKPVEHVDAKKPPKLQGGLFKSWLQGYSINDLVKGSKQFTDFVKHKLEQGSKVNSSRFAVKIGKILHLPDDVMLDLNSVVRSADKKNMDEIVGEMGNLSPLERIQRIGKIVKNAGSPTYELQAAMLVALSKFGHLYPGMVENEGTYLWYRRFGGVPNDTFFKQTKGDLEKEGKQFTEEALIILWLKKDSTWQKYNMSSSFWGELKKSWKEGREGGQKAGGEDTESMKSVDARINFAIDELRKGKKYNTFGILKPIWGKGGTAQEMNKVPFILLMSGTTKKFNEAEIRAMNNFYWEGYPFPALWFGKDDDSINLFQDVIVKLSKSIGAEKEAEKIVSMQRKFEKNGYKLDENNKTDEFQEFVKEISSFWDKHGSKLSPKLTISGDPEIFLKKDEPNNAEYAKYYNTLKSRMESSDYKLNEGGFAEGFYSHDHSSQALQGVETFLSKKVRFTSDATVVDKAGKDIFDAVVDGIRDIKNKQHDSDPVKNREYQIKLYQEYYRGTYAFIKSQITTIEKFQKSDYGKKLAKLGFNFSEDLDYEGVKAGNYNDKIRGYFDSYMVHGTDAVKVNSAIQTRNVFEGKITDLIPAEGVADSHHNDSQNRRAA